MTQSNVTTTPVATDSILFQEAFERVLPEIRALGTAELTAVNLDIPSAVTVVLGSLPEIVALRPTIAADLPKFDLVQFDKLETYTMAASYANTLFLMATQPEDALEQLMREGVTLRETLLSDASALAHRGLLSANALKDLKGINGYKNVAVDLQVLAALFREAWARIGGKSFTREDELLKADQIAADILRGVGLREQGTAAISAATDDRMRAFTLFTRAYDQVRRATVYLRWTEDNADTIAPSLFAGHGGHHKASTTSTPTPAPTGTTGTAGGTSTSGSTSGGTTTSPTPAKTGTDAAPSPVASKAIASGLPGGDPFLR